MLYNFIFKRDTIFTIGMGGFWLLGSLFWELYAGTTSAGIVTNPIAEVLVLHLIIGLGSFYFNQVLRSTKLIDNADFSAFFLSVVIMTGLGYNLVSFQFIVSFLLLLALVHKIQKGFNQTENVFIEFEVGVMAGVLTLINPVFVVVLPFAYVALVNAKVNTWRGFFAVLLGFFFIVFLKLCFFIFTDHPFYFSELIGLKITLKSFVILGLRDQISTGLLAVIFLISLNHFMKVSAQLNIKIRVFYKVWLCLSLFLLSGFLLIKNSMTVPQLLLSVNLPLLVLYQLAIRSFSKKLVKELTILILILVAILLRY